MDARIKTMVYFLTLFGVVVGFFAFLLFYPFAVEPRAVLEESVLIEYGWRSDAGFNIVRVLDDGTVIEFSNEARVGVMSTSELESIIQAVEGQEFELSRSSYWSRVACGDCRDSWVVVNSRGQSLAVESFDALGPVRDLARNI